MTESNSISRAAEDEDSDWEYEYHETETEVCKYHPECSFCG